MSQSVLTVTVENAVDLEAADLNGKSDPYVLVQVKSVTDEKLDSKCKELAKGWNQKTSIKKKNLNPTWNERLNFYCLSFLDNNGEGIKLVFKVFDWDLLSKDDKIGNAEIIVKPSELEHKKKYSASLKLKDCKSGTLNISYSVSSLAKLMVEDEFEYHSPFTPSTCQLRIPTKFSLLSSSAGADTESSAIFADLKGLGVIVISMTKQAESVDFSKLEKTSCEDQLKELRTKYKNVVVKSSKSDVKPDPQCKNKTITNIFEMALTLESAGGTKMIGNLRMVLHSNNLIVTYAFVEPDTYLALGRTELARISENSTFFDP